MFKSEASTESTPKLMTVSLIFLTEEDLEEVKLNLYKTCMMVSKP